MDTALLNGKIKRGRKKGSRFCWVKVAGIFFCSESDADHIASLLKIPTVIFGPDGDNYHTADEYVEIDSMVQATHALAYAILDLLG